MIVSNGLKASPPGSCMVSRFEVKPVGLTIQKPTPSECEMTWNDYDMSMK